VTVSLVFAQTANSTNQTKMKMVLRLLMPNATLTHEQKIIVCKAVISGIKNYTAVHNDSLVTRIVAGIWLIIYNHSYCPNITGQ
jgi:hypothetical protein